MNLTPTDRSALETALDALMMAVEAPGDPMAANRAKIEYLRAIPLVRERPAGVRRLRSDAGRRWVPRAQTKLGI